MVVSPDGRFNLITPVVPPNRILAALGILPGYGHVNVRHPEDPGRYLLSRSIAPELVTAEDILEFDLDNVSEDSRARCSPKEAKSCTWSSRTRHRGATSPRALLDMTTYLRIMYHYDTR